MRCAAGKRSKGAPQQVCAVWQLARREAAATAEATAPPPSSCHKRLTSSNSRPYPHDPSLRWCIRCARRAQRLQTIAATAGSLPLESASYRDEDTTTVGPMTPTTVAASAMMDLAHAEEFVQRREVGVADNDIDMCQSEPMDVSASLTIASFPHASRVCSPSELVGLGTSRRHLLSHRWAIMRNGSLDLQRLAFEWWNRCLSSLSACTGSQWENLHIEGDGRQSQQCEASSIPHSADMIAETRIALRDLLRKLQVDGIDEKECVVLKLIRSPPGAARQRLHYDVPTHIPLRDKHRQEIPGTMKAAHCVSVIVHLSPGTTAGTHLPRHTHADMLRLLQDEATGSLPCDASTYISNAMQQSDVAIFYDDVPHYGPAHSVTAETDISTWRWVLFAMFSPERGARQDEQQTFLSCT